MIDQNDQAQKELDAFEEAVKEEFPDEDTATSIVRIEDPEVVEGSYMTVRTMDVDDLSEVYKRMRKFVRKEMKPDLDYGQIPGTGKKTLYQPGAEKLQRFFGLSIVTELAPDGIIEQWDVPVGIDTFPLFHYRYVTHVYDGKGKRVATCEGEANSYEKKYRWRSVPAHAVPKKYKDRIDELESYERLESEFAFAVENKETQGQYGKPMEYWESWEKDIESGVAKKIKRKTRKGSELPAWERGGTFYLIPNEDIHSQVNTIIKISQKRSYVGGIKTAANASEYFTQDLEDQPNAEVEETESIYTLVPDKTTAAKALVRYASSIGVKDAGNRIKVLLEQSNLEWSLDNWVEILEMVEQDISEQE